MICEQFSVWTVSLNHYPIYYVHVHCTDAEENIPIQNCLLTYCLVVVSWLMSIFNQHYQTQGKKGKIKKKNLHKSIMVKVR